MNAIMQGPAARLLRGFGHAFNNGALLLILTASVAGGLRSYYLDSAPLSADECFSFRLAQYSSVDVVQRTALDVHPPLFYLLLKLWFGVWGACALTLRAYAAVWGIAAVPMVYLVCLEAFQDVRIEKRKAVRHAALFGALLFAIHLSQVTPGRSGRMYSLGVFLAGLSAWVLLRALRANCRKFWWWTAYGVTVAAFCYTHNYAFFSVFAQALFFVGNLVVRWRAASFQEIRAPLHGFLYAGVLALILFAPWVPVLLTQSRIVHGDFWIRELTALEVARVFFTWGTGLAPPGVWYAWCWMLAFGILVPVSLWHGDRAAWFFLLQALMPWGLALGISVLVGRPIFMDRYLVFAHFFLLGFWGWVWLRLPGALERAVLTCLVVGAAVTGLADAAARWPTGRPTIETAAEFIKSHRQAGDLVIAPYPIALNCFRCYLNQAGAEDIDLRTPYSSFARNVLMSHAYALAASDVMNPEYLSRPAIKRIWIAVDDGPNVASSAPGMEKVLERTFEVVGESSYSLILYARKE